MARHVIPFLITTYSLVLLSAALCQAREWNVHQLRERRDIVQEAADDYGQHGEAGLTSSIADTADLDDLEPAASGGKHSHHHEYEDPCYRVSKSNALRCQM